MHAQLCLCNFRFFKKWVVPLLSVANARWGFHPRHIVFHLVFVPQDVVVHEVFYVQQHSRGGLPKNARR